MPTQVLFNTGSIIFTTSSLTPVSAFVTSSTSANSQLTGGVTFSAGEDRIVYMTTSAFSMSVASASIYGTPTGSISIYKAVTESNGSASIFEIIAGPNSQSHGFTVTASVAFGFTGSGDFGITKPKIGGGGSTRTHFFISRSGKLGFGTKTPSDDIDFKADTIKFRSDDGKNEFEFKEGKIQTKKFKDLDEAEISGSELILSYTPGTFESPTIAQAGDILGSLTWEDLSIGNRDDATALRIQGKVDAVAAGGDAIKGSMRFQIGDSQAGQPINEIAILDLTGFYVSGSNRFLASTHNIEIGMNPAGSTPNDDADRKITFRNNTSNKNWSVGVNESISKFQIHQGASLANSSPDFTIDTSGNVTIVGSLTVGENIIAQEFHTEVVSSSIIYQSGSTKFGDTSDDLHEFTGSLELVGTMSKGTIDGGTF